MDPYAVSPEEQQAILAQVLRGQAAMQQASQQGRRFNNMAAIAQMANNPGAAKAAALAAATAQKQFNPQQMGNQGFVLPGTGESAPSQMFLEEQAAGRANRRGLQADRQASLAEMQQAKLMQAKELQQQRLEAVAQRAADANALRLTIAGMKQGGAKADPNAPDPKRMRQIEQDTSKFSASLDKGSVAEFADSLDIVKGTLGKYKEGKLPGYGRLAGAVPNWAADDETQTVRTNMQQAANILLKARSGAAVTDPEMRRFLTEVAQGAGMSEVALRNGWGNVEKTFGAKLNNLLAGASPEVYEEYVARGGRDFKAGGKKPDSTGVPAGVDPALWKHMTPEERKLWQN